MPMTARLAVALVAILAVLLPALAHAVEPGWLDLGLAALADAQRDLQRAMTGQVAAVAADLGWGNGAVLLSGAFLYGLAHAAGPGHGKAVIAAFIAGRPMPLRLALTLAFGAAAVQTLVALLVVVLFVVLLGESRLATLASARWLELASWVVVSGIGGWLLFRAIRPRASAAVGTDEDGCAVGCGLPLLLDAVGAGGGGSSLPETGGAPGSLLRRNDLAAAPLRRPRFAERIRRDPGPLAVTLAAGMRPCTGTVLVLLVSISLGVPLFGVAAAGAIALGTGSVVALLAAAVALGRQGLIGRLFGGGDAASGRVGRVTLGLAGALLLVLGLAALSFTAAGGSGGLLGAS